MGATDQDPLDIFTRPPPNETEGERAAREQKEAEARKISDQIDEEIRKERAALKKQQGTVRVLLLGQSESGKSTTLKNFRMTYAREEWKAELASWRVVIQLNLIRSVAAILDALQSEMDNDPAEPPHTAVDGENEYLYDPLSTPGASPTVTTSFRRPSVSSLNRTPVARASNGSLRREATSKNSKEPVLSGKHQLLKLRLAPLRQVEADLRRRLGASADDESMDVAASDTYGALGRSNASEEASTGTLKRRPTISRELTVRRLKDALVTLSQAQPSKTGVGHSSSNGDGGATREGGILDEATEVISGCREDIKSLWQDESVKLILRKRKIRLEESAGFFLDDVDRIASRDYTPSDDDVVRARLRTLGVQEYKVKFEQQGPTILGGAIPNWGNEWALYDVGGSRTLRHAWLPYFENINAIIFLAPLSCFDERLIENTRINRLEDSLLLWRTVCESKLLKKTSLVLFMNKCDLLKRKLRMGIKVKSHLPSYGDRPNDATSVVKYLREKFKDIVRSTAPEGGRVAYYYATSVTDTKTTAVTLKAVKDIILRDHLKNADFV